MKDKPKAILTRIPKELWEVLDAASYYGKISVNQLVWDSLEARRKFIEKKYIRNVDRRL